MKYLFLFTIVVYFFIQTTCAKNVSHLNTVFVSNVVDPNEYETDTLTNLTMYNFIIAMNSPFMARFGQVVNYSILFSGDTDGIITLRASDVDYNYSAQYFKSLVKNRATTSCKRKSLKGLRKALKITSEPSLILMAVNRRSREDAILVEVIEKMITKVNPIIIFQIEDDGSVSELPTSNEEINLNDYIPESIKKNNKTLFQEFSEIIDVTVDLLDAINREALTAETNPLQVPNSTLVATISELKDKYKSPRNFVFVYDIVNATDIDLDEVSLSMRTFFSARNSTFYNISDQYSVVFSCNIDTTVTIDTSSNYSAKTFRRMLDSRMVRSTTNPSLKGLRKALRIIPPFSWILYLVKDLPHDDDEMLPEIVQLIHDKKAQVKILIFGYNESCSKLPVLYKMIIYESKKASSNSNSATNWIEAVYFSKENYSQLPFLNYVKPVQATTSTTSKPTTTQYEYSWFLYKNPMESPWS